MDTHQAAASEYLGPVVFRRMQDAYRGQFSSVRDFFSRSAALSRSPEAWNVSIAGNIAVSARLLAASGFAAEAKIAAADACRMSTQWDIQGNAAVAMAMAGDAAGARKLAADLQRRFPEATTARFCYLPSVQAALALHEGKPQEAIKSLVAASPYELMIAQQHPAR